MPSTAESTKDNHEEEQVDVENEEEQEVEDVENESENEEQEDDNTKDEEEVDEENESDEEDKPAKKGKSKSKSKVDKPTKKGKADGSKSSKSKAGSKSSKSGSKGKSDEQKRYDAAFTAAAEANYVTDFETLRPKSVAEKCGSLLGLYVLQTVDTIQSKEVVDDKSYNPFPSSKFILLEDKLKGGSSGKTVKTKGSSTSKPTKKRLPIKRGQKKVAETEEDKEEKEVEETKDSDEENEDTKSSKNEDEADDKSESSKSKSKKNIVTINRNGKTYLQFIVTRFVDELYSTTEKLKLNDEDAFAQFVMKNISKDIGSQLARVVVCTVDRFKDTVADMSDNNFNKDITNKFVEYFEDRSNIASQTGEYLMKYFQLIATIIGNEAWVSSSKGVNGVTIERAMRILNLGNYEYMVKKNYISNDESDYGLTCGVLRDAREFDRLINPPLTDEQKAERAAKRTKTDKGGKSSKTKKGSKAKKEKTGDNEENEEKTGDNEEVPKKTLKKAGKAKKVVDKSDEEQEESKSKKSKKSRDDDAESTTSKKSTKKTK
jgi:hypothetical protein